MKKTAATVLIIFLVALPAVAQRPVLIPFQGVLTDSAGTPVPDGPVTIHFALYPQASEGSSVWNESQTIDLIGGIFNVYLGSQTAIPQQILANQLWLGTTVDGDVELEPRALLGVVPYSASLIGVNGMICTDGNGCLSGQCFDGVCCNQECGGACQTCGGSSAGTCEAYAVGTDPEFGCWPYFCDGSGDCSNSCTGSSDCQPGTYCSTNECILKKNDGLACASADECANGWCADGVCCQTACTEACYRCDSIGLLGVCVAEVAGTSDPLCPDGWVCDGIGSCVESL